MGHGALKGGYGRWGVRERGDRMRGLCVRWMGMGRSGRQAFSQYIIKKMNNSTADAIQVEANMQEELTVYFHFGKLKYC